MNANKYPTKKTEKFQHPKRRPQWAAGTARKTILPRKYLSHEPEERKSELKIEIVKNLIMEDTTDGFGKDRDHNQYGEVEKDPKEETDKRELPEPPNRGEGNKKKK